MTACFPKGWTGASRRLYLEPKEFPYHFGPYIVMMQPGAVAVVISHDLDEPPVVEFATAPTALTDTATTTNTSSVATATASASPKFAEPRSLGVVTATEIDGLWVAAQEGLPIDVPLTYTVRSTLGESAPVEFLAGRSRNIPFRFAAFGDTRTGHKVHRALIDSMAREPIEFVVHSGDLVEFGGVEEQWDLFWQIEGPVVSRKMLFASVGNHDESQRGHFRRYFLTQLWNNNNRFFHRDWGDVRVVIMDSEVESRPGSEQYKFLERVLREGAEKNMLMVISLHYPPYSSGSHGSYLETREILGELCPRFGVELVLAGHDHNYERTKKIDGVTYIVAASGGANIRRVSPNTFTEVLRTEPHYVLFDVDRGTLVGRTVNLAGNVFDSFVIPPNPPKKSDW